MRLLYETLKLKKSGTVESYGKPNFCVFICFKYVVIYGSVLQKKSFDSSLQLRGRTYLILCVIRESPVSAFSA